MSDAINPDHYKRLPAEAIEIIESAIDNAPSNQDAYLHGQVLKYVLRCWNKNGIEDLKKAKWYLDRLVDSLDEYEQQKASDLQSLKDHPFGKLKQPAWTPKIGDWVRIKKPADPLASASSWWPSMDKYDGQIIQVKQIEEDGVVLEEWCFLFDWLEPVEQPVIKQSLITEPPDGWRWIEVGETLRRGDTINTIDEIPEDWIGIKCAVKHNLLRRNRFEVGERVVDCRTGWLFRVQLVDKQYPIVFVAGITNGIETHHLVPYIEETKPTTEVRVEATEEVKNPLGCPDGWRFLEVGEVIRKGDVWLENGQIHSLGLLMIGQTCQTHWKPIIRRNRFEVGEKVVRVVNGVVYKVIRILSIGYQLESEFCAEVILHGKDLAPYIEDAK